MDANVTEAVPFFNVKSMSASLRFYVEGLGFALVNQWSPEGKIRWCRLTLGTASMMLQEFLPARMPLTKLGVGTSICFQCTDSLALYQGFVARDLKPKLPFVGNGLWVVPITDPDGYELFFNSPTVVAEETLYSPAPA